MILEASNGVQPLAGVGWMWGWTVYNEADESIPQYFPTRFLQGTFTRAASLPGSEIGERRLGGTQTRIARLTGGEG